MEWIGERLIWRYFVSRTHALKSTGSAKGYLINKSEPPTCPACPLEHSSLTTLDRCEYCHIYNIVSILFRNFGDSFALDRRTDNLSVWGKGSSTPHLSFKYAFVNTQHTGSHSQYLFTTIKHLFCAFMTILLCEVPRQYGIIGETFQRLNESRELSTVH